jgi:hypothetical protein
MSKNKGYRPDWSIFMGSAEIGDFCPVEAKVRQKSNSAKNWAKVAIILRTIF